MKKKESEKFFKMINDLNRRVWSLEQFVGAYYIPFTEPYHKKEEDGDEDAD